MDLAADALACIAGAPDPETVVYRPLSGGTRSILALVDREQAQTIPEIPGTLANPILVTVANSATTGIASTELNIGGDRIDVPIRVGETAVTRDIIRIVSQDKGLLTLEVAG